ncbi:hypothetical protein NIE88_04770 [Sporolactobacillus shoreicorticis]|uniref:Uncharacterized protein n=1 Tax=Sporolactobacillus shoreicorticis TaxID=1923877 RepID=A0ABW5RYE0_9BACL|nr:hypothetical protein [Sporolactobacillus shoreicorticis]MCO7125086.1 hypothetical protein [Sporolactobacillus shoreicorticis]
MSPETEAKFLSHVQRLREDVQKSSGAEQLGALAQIKEITELALMLKADYPELTENLMKPMAGVAKDFLIAMMFTDPKTTFRHL